MKGLNELVEHEGEGAMIANIPYTLTVVKLHSKFCMRRVPNMSEQTGIKQPKNQRKKNKKKKANNKEITLHFKKRHSRNNNNVFSMTVKTNMMKESWFPSRLKSKMKRRLNIANTVPINIWHLSRRSNSRSFIKSQTNGLNHYGVTDGDTLEWWWGNIPIKQLLTLSLQVFGSNREIQVTLCNHSPVHDMHEFVSKTERYKFTHNGNRLCVTDSIQDCNIPNGDTIICRRDKAKGLDSMTIEKIITKWFGTKRFDIVLCIKKHLLITNVCDSLGIPIYVINDTQSCIDKLTEFESYNPPFVGFDCEWKRGNAKVSVMQIAHGSMALLIRVHLLSKMPDALRTFCSNDKIKKCGVGIENDVTQLRKNGLELRGWIDLATCAKKHGCTKLSLQALSKTVLNQRMMFKRYISHWMWEIDDLDHIQISYASDDAVVGYLLYKHFNTAVKQKHKSTPLASEFGIADSFQWDAASKRFYDAKSGCYFDTNRNLYFCNGIFYAWNHQMKQFQHAQVENKEQYKQDGDGYWVCDDQDKHDKNGSKIEYEAKYNEMKNKNKSLRTELTALKRTLQKRNATIATLNKENLRLMLQIISSNKDTSETKQKKKGRNRKRSKKKETDL
eukprot:22491_1